MALTAAQIADLQARYTKHQAGKTAALAAGNNTTAAYAATEIRDLQFTAQIQGGTTLT